MHDEEAGERLARAGGRGDQRVVPGRDVRPALRLGLGGAVGEAAPEPRAHGRMEVGEAARRRARLGRLGRRHRAGHLQYHASILAQGYDN